jgi:hypothetical protein
MLAHAPDDPYTSAQVEVLGAEQRRTAPTMTLSFVCSSAVTSRSSAPQAAEVASNRSAGFFRSL